MFGSIFARYSGSIRIPPRFSSVRIASSVWGSPPPPLPQMVPTRSRSSFDRSSCACFSACFAAATANCEKRAIRRASLRSRYSVGSNPSTSPATWQGYMSGSSSWSTIESRPMPERPATARDHISSTLFPSGLSTPPPVITTLRRPSAAMPSAAIPPPLGAAGSLPGHPAGVPGRASLRGPEVESSAARTRGRPSRPAVARAPRLPCTGCLPRTPRRAHPRSRSPARWRRRCRAPAASPRRPA